MEEFITMIAHPYLMQKTHSITDIAIGGYTLFYYTKYRLFFIRSISALKNRIFNYQLQINKKTNIMPLKDTLLRGLRSMSYIEIERICGKPDYADPDEWVYTLKRSLFGLFSKKLHFYFLDGKVAGYSTHSYVRNVFIRSKRN